MTIKKVGILTITTGLNYGNKLQNYALCYALQKMGVQPETIRTYVNDTPAVRLATKHDNRIFAILTAKDLLTKVSSSIKYRASIQVRTKCTQRRQLAFENYKQRCIPWSQFVIDSMYVPQDIVDYYDYFICGSDQIWNPYFDTTVPPLFLNFAPKEKSIAYAASFGISQLPGNQVSEYRSYLKQFKAVSVREQRGGEIVETLTGQGAPTVLDPTMLLTADEWKQAARKPVCDLVANEYVLTYFLGEITADIKRTIHKYAGNSKKIVNLNRVSIVHRRDNQFYGVSPEEFLWLIDNARCVFTDSFHGSVFSILFHTPVYICERKGYGLNMHSRIDSLLKLLQLEWDDVNTDGVCLINQYQTVDCAICQERDKSVRFLRDALEVF